MTDKPTRADLIERLIPILKRNGWGNAREYAEHIPWMLEREGLVIVEATALTADAERIAALEGEVERLRGARDGWAFVPEEPTWEMLEAARDGVILSPNMDALMKRGLRANWKAMIRAALKGTDHDPA